MFFDYHTHSHYSFDGEQPAADMVAAASIRGIEEICFTDHVDFDIVGRSHVPDFASRRIELEALGRRYPSVAIRHGAEVSLGDDACAAAAWTAVRDEELDFIIGSVHVMDGVDVWADRYYEGQNKAEAYRRYLEAIARMLPTFPQFHVLGHYDFVAKYAPYPDRSVTLEAAPDAFDEIFRFLIEHGKAIEINTASWQEDAPWGTDILRRYRELGGEYVTVGSDTHGAERVGARIDEALELARAAGIRYVGTFQNGEPQMHKLYG